MKYRITHETLYSYSEPVAQCHNQACLAPRETPIQQCIADNLEIHPNPTVHTRRKDFFGNRVDYFSIDHAHSQMTARSICEVELTPRPEVNLTASIPWDITHESVQSIDDEETFQARQFQYDSPLITADQSLRDFALSVFLPGRPLLESVDALMRKIHSEFRYDPGFTTISTPLPEVLAHRRGVCQDFAHLAIGCLRSLGLPARYVSGYIETIPPPGVPKLAGADATHAWFAAFVPGIGWVDFDPTNNMTPNGQHITTAWGRDYSDISPLKGVIFGSGDHQLSVKVDVQRLDDVQR